MYELDQETIYDLPFHDSDFHGTTIKQEDNGNTNLIIKITLFDEELSDLNADLLEHIKKSGKVSILLKNCKWIRINVVSNITQRDTVNSIEILKNTPKMNEFSFNTIHKHVVVTLNSGTKIESLTEKIALM